jgi:hypothetical protein
MIKRIKSAIPKIEYLYIYDALFMSHLSYCISCWGGIPEYKLHKIFAIQKRCMRLLFGKTLNRDHQDFYETCARARTIDGPYGEKNFALEPTKPLYNEHGILNVQNLYRYHIFMETSKIFEFSTPIYYLYNEHGILNIQNLYRYHIFMETSIILKFSTPIFSKPSFLPKT